MNIRPERFLVGTGNQTIQDTWIRLENLFQNFCPFVITALFCVLRFLWSDLYWSTRGEAIGRRDNIDIIPKVISPPQAPQAIFRDVPSSPTDYAITRVAWLFS